MFFNQKNRLLAVLLCICIALSLLAGCRNNETTPPVTDNDANKTYEPYVLPAPTFTEDTTDYRAMALAVFEGVATAPAEHFAYEVTEENTIRLTAYTGEGGTLVIPDTIDGKPVTTLGEGLFQNSETITALSIPESVTSIEKDLLSGCRTIQVLRSWVQQELPRTASLPTSSALPPTRPWALRSPPRWTPLFCSIPSPPSPRERFWTALVFAWCSCPTR